MTHECKPICANFVYIIGSKTIRGYQTYVGWTTNLSRRLTAHNLGRGARFTRGRKWELLYAEKYDNRSEAMQREYDLKRNRKLRNHVRYNQN